MTGPKTRRGRIAAVIAVIYVLAVTIWLSEQNITEQERLYRYAYDSCNYNLNNSSGFSAAMEQCLEKPGNELSYNVKMGWLYSLIAAVVTLGVIALVVKGISRLYRWIQAGER